MVKDFLHKKNAEDVTKMRICHYLCLLSFRPSLTLSLVRNQSGRLRAI